MTAQKLGFLSFVFFFLVLLFCQIVTNKPYLLYARSIMVTCKLRNFSFPVFDYSRLLTFLIDSWVKIYNLAHAQYDTPSKTGQNCCIMTWLLIPFAELGKVDDEKANWSKLWLASERKTPQQWNSATAPGRRRSKTSSSDRATRQWEIEAGKRWNIAKAERVHRC